ncbi:MAG: hypothetical protein J5532_06800, partial [Lachnospiraceae bacterium]|nr:hypothetical protein [Lachnospiraceae bacterium]
MDRDTMKRRLLITGVVLMAIVIVGLIVALVRSERKNRGAGESTTVTVTQTPAANPSESPDVNTSPTGGVSPVVTPTATLT